jgi:chromosome partitioning protein
MKVITFASSKGGVGKTTSAIILGTILMRHHQVTMIDTDPNRSLARWAERAPAHPRLKVIASKGEKSFVSELDRAKVTSDYVIVDTQGAGRSLTSTAMGESDLVIIPMADEHADAEQAIDTMVQLKREAKARGREIPVRILFARTKDGVTKSRLQKSVNMQVRDNIGAFTTELAERTAYSALHAYGRSLYDLDPKEVNGVTKAIGNAELFVEELLEVMEQESWSRKEKREKDPTIQMSVRMKEPVYETFRKLCIANRLSNGQMMEVLIAGHLREQDNGPAVS